VRVQPSAGRRFRQLASKNPCERGPSQQQHCFRGNTAQGLHLCPQIDGLWCLRVQLALVASNTKWTWKLGRLWLASFRESQWLLLGGLLQKPLRPEFLRPGVNRLLADATTRLHSCRASEVFWAVWCGTTKPCDAGADGERDVGILHQWCCKLLSDAALMEWQVPLGHSGWVCSNTMILAGGRQSQQTFRRATTMPGLALVRCAQGFLPGLWSKRRQ